MGSVKSAGESKTICVDHNRRGSNHRRSKLEKKHLSPGHSFAYSAAWQESALHRFPFAAAMLAGWERVAR